MRRFLDYVLVIAILAGVGYGAYRLGNVVDDTSTRASTASGPPPTATTTAHRSTHHSPSRHTLEIVIVAVAGAAGVMLLVSLGSAAVRGTRRQRWRAP